MKFTMLAISSVAAASGALAQSASAGGGDAVPTVMPTATPDILKCTDPWFKSKGCANQDWMCALGPSAKPTDPQADSTLMDCVSKLGPAAYGILAQMQQVAGASIISAMGITATAPPDVPTPTQSAAASPTSSGSPAGTTLTPAASSSSAGTSSTSSGTATGSAAKATKTSGAKFNQVNVLSVVGAMGVFLALML